MKKNFFNYGIWGYDSLKREGKLPDPKKLERTHAMIYDTNETNLDKLFKMANSPNWFDTPEEQKKLKSLGVSHTSMSIGDIIKV